MSDLERLKTRAQRLLQSSGAVPIVMIIDKGKDGKFYIYPAQTGPFETEAEALEAADSIAAKYPDIKIPVIYGAYDLEDDF